MADKGSEAKTPKENGGNKEFKMAAPSKFANKDRNTTRSALKSAQEGGRYVDSDKQNSGDCSSTQKSIINANAWNCNGCDAVFVDENDCLLTCEYCGKNRCLKCVGLTKTVYKAINGRPDIPWFCSDCILKSMGILKEAKSIEDRCSEFLSDFSKKIEDRMANFEKNIDEMRSDMGAMKEELLKEIKDKGNSVVGIGGNEGDGSIKVSDDSSTNNKILSSLQDRMNRKNNVVLYNVEEGAGNIKDDKIKHDKQETRKVAAEIGVNLVDDDIISVKRVGRKGATAKIHGEEKEVPRVLIVTFTETVKSVFMRNAYKLQFSSSEYLKKVSVKHDMSYEERKRERELRNEAKDKTEKEGNENFLFLVRGPLWDRKIVKVKKISARGDSLQAG